jgi:hypothetical protein
MLSKQKKPKRQKRPLTDPATQHKFIHTKKFDALGSENKANLDLKYKVSSLGPGKHQTENKPKETQTDYDDEFGLEFPCKE